MGDYQLFGSQYAMRIWLDPAKLNNFGLTPGDVGNALQAQNVRSPPGELGGLPSVKGQQLNATIIGPQRLQNAEQFGQILLRVNPNGSRVLLRDVARVELGPESYAVNTKYNGHAGGRPRDQAGARRQRAGHGRRRSTRRSRSWSPSSRRA